MKNSNSKVRIRELMEHYRINQTELCKRTGIQKSALSNYLKGDREPRQDQISAIVDPFGVNPAWLMGYDVPMYMSPSSPAGSSAPSPGSESSSLVLSDLEQDLIRAFREASPDLRTAACAVLGVKREQGSVMEGSSAS